VAARRRRAGYGARSQEKSAEAIAPWETPGRAEQRRFNFTTSRNYAQKRNTVDIDWNRPGQNRIGLEGAQGARGVEWPKERERASAKSTIHA
jgi:hypothetical protein